MYRPLKINDYLLTEAIRGIVKETLIKENEEEKVWTNENHGPTGLTIDEAIKAIEFISNNSEKIGDEFIDIGGGVSVKYIRHADLCGEPLFYRDDMPTFMFYDYTIIMNGTHFGANLYMAAKIH